MMNVTLQLHINKEMREKNGDIKIAQLSLA
jgi:hypothetical protein